MKEKRSISSQPKNKEIRQQLHKKAKIAKQKQKLLRRLELKELDPKDRPINIPKTLENTAQPNPLAVSNGKAEEIAQILQTDEFASFFAAPMNYEPRILLTSSKNPSKKTQRFLELLSDVFPTSEYIKRGPEHQMKEIVEGAIERGFTAICVVSEGGTEKAAAIPTFLKLIHLPNGPTAYFRLSSLVMPREFEKRARSTEHYPELILNNFSSQLGLAIGRFFVSLFPKSPEFRGRQAVTFHNQRDFIFFRRHRYQIRENAEGEAERVNLQEIGPRFCLKLISLQKGCYRQRTEEADYVWKESSYSERNKFYL